VFGLSEATIESLEQTSRQADFAVLVLAADDTVRTRGRHHAVPRDNVIFELGLFMGAIGRSRTFMVVEKSTKKVRIPPDLKGVTYLQIDSVRRQKSLIAATKEIRKRIAELGPR